MMGGRDCLNRDSLSHGIYYGISIAVTIRSLEGFSIAVIVHSFDPSLSTQLIAVDLYRSHYSFA